MLIVSKETSVKAYVLCLAHSDVLNGSAVCVYRMQDIIRAFKGNFYHREGPQYKWAEFTGRVPYPRPGTVSSLAFFSFEDRNSKT